VFAIRGLTPGAFSSAALPGRGHVLSDHSTTSERLGPFVARHGWDSWRFRSEGPGIGNVWLQRRCSRTSWRSVKLFWS